MLGNIEDMTFLKLAVGDRFEFAFHSEGWEGPWIKVGRTHYEHEHKSIARQVGSVLVKVVPVAERRLAQVSTFHALPDGSVFVFAPQSAAGNGPFVKDDSTHYTDCYKGLAYRAANLNTEVLPYECYV